MTELANGTDPAIQIKLLLLLSPHAPSPGGFFIVKSRQNHLQFRKILAIFVLSSEQHHPPSLSEKQSLKFYSTSPDHPYESQSFVVSQV